jgi:hypothetical protein
VPDLTTPVEQRLRERLESLERLRSEAEALSKEFQASPDFFTEGYDEEENDALFDRMAKARQDYRDAADASIPSISADCRALLDKLERQERALDQAVRFGNFILSDRPGEHDVILKPSVAYPGSWTGAGMPDLAEVIRERETKVGENGGSNE